jgi:hypothetical protein
MESLSEFGLWFSRFKMEINFFWIWTQTSVKIFLRVAEYKVLTAEISIIIAYLQKEA